MTIPELFELYGEAEFRALEQRVIARILESGPQVLSTGGGAFMNEQTRAGDRWAWRFGLAEGRHRHADGARVQEAEPAAAQECRSARGHGEADGGALSGLCDGRCDRANARRAQGSDRDRGDRGAGAFAERLAAIDRSRRLQHDDADHRQGRAWRRAPTTS